jgi:Adenylate kinase and related kinases
MQKIIIIGSPGAGKSSFARQLRDILNIPLYYLDMIWHKPDQTTLSREEFDIQLENIMKTESWIIDGNYQRTLETRLKKCDSIFLLDIPLESCLLGAKSRIGKKREDLPWIETQLDEEFMQWIMDFPEKQKPHMMQLLEKYKNDKEIIIFQSRQEIDNYILRLKQKNI